MNKTKGELNEKKTNRLNISLINMFDNINRFCVSFNNYNRILNICRNGGDQIWQLPNSHFR